MAPAVEGRQGRTPGPNTRALHGVALAPAPGPPQECPVHLRCRDSRHTAGPGDTGTRTETSRSATCSGSSAYLFSRSQEGRINTTDPREAFGQRRHAKVAVCVVFIVIVARVSKVPGPLWACGKDTLYYDSHFPVGCLSPSLPPCLSAFSLVSTLLPHFNGTVNMSQDFLQLFLYKQSPARTVSISAKKTMIEQFQKHYCFLHAQLHWTVCVLCLHECTVCQAS